MRLDTGSKERIRKLEVGSGEKIPGIMKNYHGTEYAEKYGEKAGNGHREMRRAQGSVLRA